MDCMPIIVLVWISVSTSLNYSRSIVSNESNAPNQYWVRYCVTEMAVPGFIANGHHEARHDFKVALIDWFGINVTKVFQDNNKLLFALI